jgi:hypothetical protein
MRRIVLLTCAVLLCAAPASHAAATVGVSDQNPLTFNNPLYKPLKFKVARYIAPYDALSDPKQSVLLADWIRNARAQKQKILISFEHSRRSGRQKQAPSVATYTTALKKFKAKYPYVKEWSPWNEVNRCQTNGRNEGQPTAICSIKKGGPKRAAQYYAAARKVCGTSCKIVALDILDGDNVGGAVSYIRAFKRFAKPTPKIWGIHNYSDTNRFSSSRTKRLLAETRTGEVWLTETGGIVKLGTSFPFSTSRAAKALGCMFTLGKSNSRIKRLYVYQFNGAPSFEKFDAGLVSIDGDKRPGYAVVQKRKPSKCAKK